MVTEVELATELVVTEKVAEEAPAETVTLAGTCAAAVLLLDRVTVAPPAGAAPLRVTVPVAELPPFTVAGFTATEDKDTVDVEPEAFKATIAVSQPSFPSVQLVLKEPVADTMRYAGTILLALAASVRAIKELVGPAVVAARSVSAAAARIKSWALLVTAVGVVGVVLTPELVALPAFHDASAKQGVGYRYSVQAVSRKGVEGAVATVVVEP